MANPETDENSKAKAMLGKCEDNSKFAFDSYGNVLRRYGGDNAASDLMHTKDPQFRFTIKKSSRP